MVNSKIKSQYMFYNFGKRSLREGSALAGLAADPPIPPIPHIPRVPHDSNRFPANPSEGNIPEI